MKKFLSILAAVGLTATASTAVVACTTSVKYGDVATDGTATVKEKDAKSAHLVEKQDDKWVLIATDPKIDGTIKDKDGKEVAITVAFALVNADGKNGDVKMTLTIPATHGEVKKTTLKIKFSYQLKGKDKKDDGKLNISGFKLDAKGAASGGDKGGETKPTA